MYKYIIALGFVVSGCSNIAINGMMCDEIRADPFSTIPSECRNYVDSAAKKASRAPSNILPPEDLLIVEKKK
jgi:hypothetical protein